MQLFVNLAVKDLDRSKEFFTALGFAFFGMADDMASVMINDGAQVMLLTEPLFAGYAARELADPAKTTEAILVIGLENPAQVDELTEKAVAAGATPLGPPRQDDFRYQRAFADLDGHHWEALCLAQPAG
ncbi:VOC family protein [Nonomuraea harbinensis]|uniref:VOC family protein n=1 Tax=Nonomuraea harbinensis TaxID=1286938 RepID=A0ABW1BTD6_9ACTN|nr:VOC family protein [Nonomuraea harbinensis]